MWPSLFTSTPKHSITAAGGAKSKVGQRPLPSHQHEMETADKGEEHHNKDAAHWVRNKVELCFTYHDIAAAFKHAVKKGAVMVAAPEEKEWGQKVGYVADIDGHVIRMGSALAQP